MVTAKSVTILDGTALARRRATGLAARAGAVTESRGRAPGVLIVAFADGGGRAPFVARKLQACARAGVTATPLILPADVDAPRAIRLMRATLREGRFDGVFVQVPFPEGFDGDALVAAIPVDLDIDVMTVARSERFMNGEADTPPITVSAALLLLDAWAVPIAGRRGIVVAHVSAFAEMFRAALARRGAVLDAIVEPSATGLDERVGGAGLVVVAAATPGLVRSSWLADGAVAIDVGYFNAGGRGDIDTNAGIDHLTAIAPVPGGIGPMTVSALVERVIAFAEG
jgi:methylenetetrahydrofolate dehydrogenase (NADP+) / methenyltetrahydrofolate cyclohydrolase